MNKQRILVTGASGFIGNALINLLKKEAMNHMPDYEIIGISRNISEQNEITDYYLLNYRKCDITCALDVQSLMTKYPPTMIFHLAANPLVSDGKPNITQTNILGTHNLLEYCPQGCKFIFISSATVYGDLGKEKICTETDLCNPTSIYGITKLACEKLIEIYTKQNKINSLILRLVAQVGPNNSHGVLKDFINKTLSLNSTFPILGQFPGSYKPYMHVNDTVKIIKSMGINHVNGIFNIAPNNSIYTKIIADIVTKRLNKLKEYIWTGQNWFGDNPVVKISNEKINKLYHFLNTIINKTSEEAIIQAIDDEMRFRGLNAN